MARKMFLSAEDVANELKVSKSYAYKLIRKMNEEMKVMGYLTISGRINRDYFLEKLCYGNDNNEGK